MILSVLTKHLGTLLHRNSLNAFNKTEERRKCHQPRERVQRVYLGLWLVQYAEFVLRGGLPCLKCC